MIQLTHPGSEILAKLVKLARLSKFSLSPYKTGILARLCETVTKLD
jgi:hypothetical protein